MTRNTESAKPRNIVEATKGRAPTDMESRVKPRGVYSFEAFSPFRLVRPVAFLESIADVKLGDEGVAGAILHNARKLGVVSVGHFGRLFTQLGAQIKGVDLGNGGDRLWAAVAENRVVNTGLDEMLNQFWKGSAYTAAHYIGLTDGTPTDAAIDTMASHVGWAEVTGYSEGARQTITFGTVASQSVDNSGSKATITASGSITVGGGFATTDSTKGGTGGILISIAAFTGGDESLTSSETLTMTYTSTMADDGV